MDLKSFAVFLLLTSCAMCASVRIPSPQNEIVQSRSLADSTLNTTMDHFRNVFSLFPCSDREVVEQVFNIFKVIRSPKIPERLETEEAEMKLLYLMIFGKNSSVPLTRWYLIFEKTVDTFDTTLPNRDERLKIYKKMLDAYLTHAQMKRLHIFAQFFQTDRPTNLKTLLAYLYGIPIGLALGVPQDDTTSIIENHSRVEEIATELGRLANKLCESIHHSHYNYNDHIVRDLLLTMLTKK